MDNFGDHVNRRATRCCVLLEMVETVEIQSRQGRQIIAHRFNGGFEVNPGKRPEGTKEFKPRVVYQPKSGNSDREKRQIRESERG